MYLSGLDYLAHPFVGMWVSVFVTAGFAQCGRWLANRLYGYGRVNGADRVAWAAGFVVVVGLVGVVVHTLALAGLLQLWWLRLMGVVFGLCGVWGMVRCTIFNFPFPVRNFPLNQNQKRACASNNHVSQLERVGWCIVGTILVALLFAALAPATDGDSIHYHLGVPVDWLNAGGAVARPYWLHAHFVGLGEMINLLGLALGTTNLGAAVQYGSLWVILVGLVGATGDVWKKQTLLAILIVVGTPVMIFLVPNQKPQLFPAAATTIGLILLVRSSKLTVPVMTLSFGAVAVAIGCKYPSLVTGGIVILFGLWKAWKDGRFWHAVAIVGGMTLLFAGGIWLRNVWFYGDPLSPFLHSLFAPDDLIRDGFSAYLRAYDTGVQPLWHVYLTLPFRFIVPFELKLITAVLGIGVLGFIVADWRETMSRPYLIVTLISTIALLASSQLTARFFIEPYIWSAIAVAVSGRLHDSRREKWREWLMALMMVQGVGVAMLALFAAVTLFPGSLTPNLFDATLTRTVEGYALHDWLDEELPAEAVIHTDLRTGMLLPRSFLSADFGRYWYTVPLPPDVLLAEFLAEFEQAKAERGVTHLVFETDVIEKKPWRVVPCVGEPIAKGVFAYEGGRNPFGRNERTIDLVILPLTC